MKYAKMLGIAIGATAALMAFLGAGTASANSGVLCSAQENPCLGVNKWPLKTVIDASLKTTTSTTFSITTGEVFNTCTVSTLKTELTANPDLAGEATTTNTELTWPMATCTDKTVIVKLGKLRVQNIAANWNGTVFADEVIEFTIMDPFGSCVYTIAAGTDIGEIKEGKPATLVVNAVFTEKGGVLCFSSGRWKGEYTITSPANTTLAVSPK